MSNNNTNTQETTFWKFLTDNTIEIPIIQRDYAQGRLGKEYLRKIFLADIKNALENKSKMKLDFVYGSVENEKMSPLDGQQRLTTLWLLHWYIALMSDNLNEEVCKTLAKFTYETRISSREFCQNLCRPENFTAFKDFKPTEKRRIVDYITSRTWFYSAWKQDPTIQSMLRMLGGTEINDRNGKDIIDGLEELLNCLESCVFKPDEKCKLKRNVQYYWDLLVSEDAPIVFYQLSLKDIGDPDDLYIKMNARGKQLTSFENFKADLIGYIRDNNWTDLFDAKNGIPIKMDTTWTDIFWKNKSKDNRIDEIYFAFLNRFFLCELICQKEINDYIDSAEKLEKENSTFKYLYGKESNDANIDYVGWEKYGDIPLSHFNDLKSVLDNHIEKFQKFFPDWANKGSQFQFIPEYKEDNAITTLTQSERVVFHAISKYLQKGDFDVESDAESFKQWMRVVWNIVENANINSIATMIGAIRLIDELGEHSHNIYEFLANENSKIKSEAAKDQVKEEIAKAKQIIDGGDIWKEAIIKAENYAFFKGAIRFLFQDADGNITEESWNQFDTKWGNVQKYFDKDGNGVAENYKKTTKLLRALLSRIDISEQWFGNYAEFWHSTLLNNDTKILPAVHYLLSTEELDVASNCEDWIQDEKLLEILLSNSDRWHILINWRNYSVITRYSRRETNPLWIKEIVVLNSQRNKILQSPDISIKEDCIIGSGNFLYGWNIDYKFKDFYFQWFGNPNGKELDVYLMEENWSGYKKRISHTTDKDTDESIYYCFRVNEGMSQEDFLKKHEGLINEANTPQLITHTL